MPILIDNTRLIQPQKLQVGVLGSAETRHSKEQHHPGTPHQLYAFFQGFGIQKVLCILQDIIFL